jgi:hypothetical protein
MTNDIFNTNNKDNEKENLSNQYSRTLQQNDTSKTAAF